MRLGFRTIWRIECVCETIVLSAEMNYLSLLGCFTSFSVPLGRLEERRVHAAADVFSTFSVSLGRLDEQRVQRPMCFPLRLVPWSGCSEEERYVLLGECSGSVSRAALRAEHVCESIAVSVESDGHSGCVATRIGSLFPEFFPDLPGLWRIGILLCIALTFLLVRWCCACLLVCLRRPTQDALSVYCLFVCLCLVLRALLVKLQVSVTRSFYALLRLCPFVVARN